MTDANSFFITGLGLACAAGTRTTDLLDAVRQRRIARSPVSLPWVGDAPSSRVDVAVAQFALDEVGPVQRLRYVTRESALFLYAGAIAARQAGIDPSSQPRSVGVVCATQAAGLVEYVQVYRSGRTGKDTGANPVRGPQSSFNAPASHLSLHLGTQGPCLTVAGGPASGLTALGYAQSLLRTGRVEVALAGGVDGLSPGTPTPGRLPGEAAAVLALTAGRADGLGGPPAVARLAPVVDATHAPGTDLLRTIIDRALGAAGLDAAIVDAIVATDPATSHLIAAHRDLARRWPTVLITEDGTGMVGAAGGSLAVTAAVQYLAQTGAPHVLCVSGDPTTAVAAAVVSRAVKAGGR